MSRAQKIARFDLIVALTGLTLSVVSVGVLYFVVGLPLHRAVAGFGFIGICGLAGFSPLLYKKESGSVSFDERDIFICKRALFAGLMTLVFVVLLECMMSFLAVGPGGAISIGGLLTILLVGLMSLCFAESVAVLVQYGWGWQADRE